MTLSLSDLSGINQSVRCDPSGSIASTNTKKIVDALKKLAEEFDGETLEDIINSVVGGGGGATLNYLEFRQQFSEAIVEAEFGGVDLDLSGTIASSWGTHVGTEYIAGERFQLEADGITITDMTGGPPYILTVGADMRIIPTRDTSGWGWVKVRSGTAAPTGSITDLLLKLPFHFPNVALVGTPEAPELTATRTRIMDTNVGHQFKLEGGVVEGVNPPTFFEVGSAFLRLHYYD
jgi:hypothetical protein